MITKYIKGDITKTECTIIAHGVNAQNAMGSGVALALFKKWSKVKSEYHKFYYDQVSIWNFEPKQFLGLVQKVNVGKGKVVLNCFTQENFGYGGALYVDYDALRTCFKKINAEYRGAVIAIPKIGCGLAGGDWGIVSAIIDDETRENNEVWVYEI